MTALIAIVIYGAYGACWAAMADEAAYTGRQCALVALLWPLLPAWALFAAVWRWFKRRRR